VRRILLSVLAGLTTVSLGLASTHGAPAAKGPSVPIRLRTAQFVPSEGPPALPARLRSGPPVEGERATWLVQFAGPVRPEWKAAVGAEGVELLDYLPDFAFKVRMTPAEARAVRALSSVAWVGRFHPAYKLSPRLRTGGERLYVVRLERGVDGPRAAAEIDGLGSRVWARRGRTLVVSADAVRLDSLARHRGVAWIENYVLRKTHNEYGGGQIMGAALAWAGGYDGSTQTVAVADTGIGGGTAAMAHPDIPAGRIAGIFNLPGSPDGCFGTIVNDGAVDVDSGHGTHTSASVLGDGDAALKGRGTAPGASLVFQAIENYAVMSFLCQLYGYPDGYYLTGIPANLGDLFQQAYTAGARVHSNSWGADVAGDYTVDSANADTFLWSHRDMTVTFSAGNAGTDADGNGGVDGGSIGSPATAKNVIAVGATENDRASDYECDAGVYAVCDFQGGQNEIFTYWESWPFDFPAEPLKSDPTAGNAEQMAAFSSRGPAADGRLKPDVVAPGTWVLSAYSSLYQEGYGDPANPQTGLYQYDGWGFPRDEAYKYMGGTSMSNALVAGAATVVRDFYQVYHSHPASAALVKATLVNSAVDLLDENNDGLDDNAMPIPNVYEGWGRVDLAGATDGSRLFRDEEDSLQTGASTSFTYDVAAGTPLRVTLAWTDYPATESAFRSLVNDLDLEVSGPGGVLYLGNVFGAGWSSQYGLPDRVNNVENVFVEAPAEGLWTVTVHGYNVPQGPQPFTLVIGGQVSEPSGIDTPPTVTLTSPPDGATVSGTVSVSAEASDDHGITQVEFLVDGISIGVDTVPPYAVSWDTTSASAGAHTVSAVATDTGAQTAQSSVSVTVAGPAATALHVADLDGSSSVVNSRRWTATVTIAVLDDLAQPVPAASVQGVWTDKRLRSGSCVTDASGLCSVSRTFSNRSNEVLWTVSNVEHAELAYDLSANTDPDGDSNGTQIAVARP
jgi:hypothetical protein